MSDHKVYDYPPIAMVAVEVRHAGQDPLSSDELSAIRHRLRKEWPVQLSGQDIVLEVAGANPSTAIVEYQRFVTKDRRTAIVIRPGATTVETVDYKGWDDLRSTLEAALEARSEISEPSGYERVGLRYINELRTPFAEDSNWAEWVHPSLLAAQPDEAIGLSVSDWQGMSKFGPIDGCTFVLRFGPRTGYAVTPDGPLKRQSTPTGPFFLLDFDSFWEIPSSDDSPEFASSALLKRCDDLHKPIRAMFEGLITDRLREDVLDGQSEL